MSVTELPTRATPDFDRTPPQDIAAEQSVLGGMLLSKDAIADVVEVLRGGDFYRPAHELVYDAILDLYGRGEPADPVTVAAELTKRGEMARAGGAPYLHTLISTVPTAANAGFYAEIVRERAVLRRLVEAGTRIVQMGYATEGGETDAIVDRAQAEIYAVTERRTSEDYVPLSAVMESALDEIEAIGSRGGELVGVPTGFVDLDELTNGLHGGQLVIVAGRPAMGKSTLGLDVARAAAIRHQLSTCIFSLEMSRNEITMRLLSAEARVPLHHMRTGKMTDDDWNRLARRMGEVSSAPMFIDDSPNMSMMEIRAKCRRLRQRHDLRLVVVDYLQLMSSGKRVESRQQEVSEFSRSLKLLAKELDVPVIALSQLNRGPEQRTDKRPQLADLRESGCLTADTRVLRADTGAEVTLGELHAAGARDVPVWSLDAGLRWAPRQLTHVFPTGRREVFQLQLASGRELRATANHPFLTVHGWRPLGALHVGDQLAVPRHVPAPATVACWSDEEVLLLGELLVRTLARPRPPVPAWRQLRLAPWLQRLGLYDVAERDLFVPIEVFRLPKRQVARLLAQVLDAWPGSGGAGTPQLTVTSRRLVDDVARLLLRFGISGRITCAGAPDGATLWTLRMDHPEDRERLARAAAGVSADHQQAGELVARTPPLWQQVSSVLAASAAPQQEPVVGVAAGAAALSWPAPSDASPLTRVAALLEQADLALHATNDVVWDEVTSIEPAGVAEVFDATVPGTHNFIANGIVVHNSIEQDADIVMLLHREDVYEKESPRAGEADVIVAKHRNGPTATVTVAFQGHYSRFVDMAQM